MWLIGSVSVILILVTCDIYLVLSLVIAFAIHIKSIIKYVKSISQMSVWVIVQIVCVSVVSARMLLHKDICECVTLNKGYNTDC